jgi:hypothetical protein
MNWLDKKNFHPFSFQYEHTADGPLFLCCCSFVNFILVTYPLLLKHSRIHGKKNRGLYVIRDTSQIMQSAHKLDDTTKYLVSNYPVPDHIACFVLLYDSWLPTCWLGACLIDTEIFKYHVVLCVFKNHKTKVYSKMMFLLLQLTLFNREIMKCKILKYCKSTISTPSPIQCVHNNPYHIYYLLCFFQLV